MQYNIKYYIVCIILFMLMLSTYLLQKYFFNSFHLSVLLEKKI